MEATPVHLRAMTKPFKPLAGLTAPLRGLLMAALVTDLAAVLTDLYVSVEYADVPGDRPYDGLFLESDGLNGLVSLGPSAIGLAALIVFLMWIHRANRNVHLLSGETLAITPGWALGWFFIPVREPVDALRGGEGDLGRDPPRDRAGRGDGRLVVGRHARAGRGLGRGFGRRG